MKKKSTSKSAFFNLRVLIASAFCLIGVFVALLGSGAFSNLSAQTKGAKQAGVVAGQDAPGTQTAGRRPASRSGPSETGLAKASLRRAERGVR